MTDETNVPQTGVKLDLNPSDKIINHAYAELDSEVIDRDGKIYKLKVPDPLDEFDLSAALGKDNSTNLGLLVQAMPLIYIESVNGVRFEKPGNYNEIRAALKRLGRNGMSVVMKAIQKYQVAEQAALEDIDSIKK